MNTNTKHTGTRDTGADDPGAGYAGAEHPGADTYMDRAENALLRTYKRFPIVFERGGGVYLYDKEGKRYLDFAAGIAVSALGYSNDSYKEALKAQIDKIIHTSNLFYNEPIIAAAEKSLAASGMDRVFFTNSGAEAVEGAIKAAKKYACRRDGFAGHEVIAMDRGFHGRTLGALSVTGTESYRAPFEPLIPGVRFAHFNELASVKALMSEKTCCVIMETIQGEGGIYPADPKFLTGVRNLCDEYGALLILDEIQCGMGRSGYMFAWQGYGVRPDIMTAAKALGGGVPVGAFFMREEIARQSLETGDHGTTYGGNPLVGAAVCAVFDEFERLGLLEHVRRVSEYLSDALDGLAGRHSSVIAHRGMGLIRGLKLSVPAADVARRAMERGLVVITAGGNVVRLVPPLVIEKEHIDEMIGILGCVLD